jgi:PEP-CTERM motif
LIAALAAAAQPGTAAIYTYSWESGSSFSFADGVTASPTGEVAVDPKESNFLSDKIVLTGSGAEAGTYAPDVFDGTDTLGYGDGSAYLEFTFVGGLYAGEAAKLVNVAWSSVQSGDLRNANKVSGGLELADSLGASAVPEPSTWLLLGVGAGALALARGKRKARPANAPADLRCAS